MSDLHHESIAWLTEKSGLQAALAEAEACIIRDERGAVIHDLALVQPLLDAAVAYGAQRAAGNYDAAVALAHDKAVDAYYAGRAAGSVP